MAEKETLHPGAENNIPVPFLFSLAVYAHRYSGLVMHPEQVIDRVQPDPLCLCRVHADHDVKHQAVDERVSIARAMVNHLDILFADEPCANPGSENSTLVLDLFKEMNEEMHQTIVMVSHEDWHKKISTGSSTCVTVCWIRHGYSKEKTG